MTSVLLEQAMKRRAAHKGLKVNFERMRHFNSLLFDDGAGQQGGQTLYVGVGHGHDALLAIVDGQTESVIGVDPFIAGHGNDDEDLERLGEIIGDMDFREIFAVKRMFIEQYLTEATEKVDRIVCSDVLHHIFETSERLTKSNFFSGAVELFKSFYDTVTDDGVLLVADVSRHGFRQYVHGVARPLGFARFHGNYTRKQQWREWDAAILAAGWHRQAVHNYIPFALKDHPGLLDGWLGRATLCDKYILAYRKH